MGPETRIGPLVLCLPPTAGLGYTVTRHWDSLSPTAHDPFFSWSWAVGDRKNPWVTVDPRDRIVDSGGPDARFLDSFLASPGPTDNSVHRLKRSGVLNLWVSPMIGFQTYEILGHYLAGRWGPKAQEHVIFLSHGRPNERKIVFPACE